MINDWWSIVATWPLPGKMAVGHGFARASSKAEAIGLGYMKWSEHEGVNINASKCPDPVSNKDNDHEQG